MTTARNAWGLAAIIVATASITGCESDPPVATKSYDTLSAAAGPAATGTVRLMRTTGARDYQNGSTIVSSYFRTTPTNREVRRGIVEFPAPAFEGSLMKAVLSLSPEYGRTTTPVPSDTHIVSWYRGNRIVELIDFDRSATQIATFLTDNNDSVRPRLYFDVTEALRATPGEAIGFRVELKNDLSMTSDGFAGMSFSGANSAAATPELLITSLRER